VRRRLPESGWCAVVENIERIPLEFERLRERIHRRGQPVERKKIAEKNRNSLIV